MTDLQLNPFEDTSRAVVPAGAAAQTDQQRAIAEVQAAMVVARANPRNQRVAADRILNACQRPGLAEAAVYSYSRGGTDISGPSIRLAEAIAQNWGNMQFGIRELEQANGCSTVQAFAWDVETNTRREVTFQVRHERHTKAGAKRLTDPRDIYETVANNGARRLRACILAVVPGDVTEAAVRQCEETMKAKADTTPAGVEKLVKAFAELGVTKKQIEDRIQRRLDAITAAQVVSLRKVFASLRDGMSDPADWFDQTAEAKPEQSKQTVAPDSKPPDPKVEPLDFAVDDEQPKPAPGRWWIGSTNGSDVRLFQKGMWDMPDEDAMRSAHGRLVAELREKPTRPMELYEVAHLVMVQRRAAAGGK